MLSPSHSAVEHTATRKKIGSSGVLYGSIYNSTNCGKKLINHKSNKGVGDDNVLTWVCLTKIFEHCWIRLMQPEKKRINV